MQEHYWEEAAAYDVRVTRGYTDLKESAYSKGINEPIAPYNVAPADKSNMMRYLFGGFRRGLYPVEKFASEAERRMAAILECDALKWFKPAKGQFQIYYRNGPNHAEYQPDFVAETAEGIYLLEPKAANQMDALEVLAKKAAAVEWCRHATAYNTEHGGKPWLYALIPHDAIAENMTLKYLVERYGVK
jgi:type III restriction enzyme